MSQGPERPAKLWGGRFRGGVDPVIDRYTTALGFDRRLLRCDLIGSLAHARMLWEQEILDDASARSILEGLSELLVQAEADALEPADSEDIHSWIERQLVERIGDAGRRLHTGRSRNDQTSTALRLYVREVVVTLVGRLRFQVEALVSRAGAETETFLPGYTHLQRGQPTSLAHHLLAHAWPLLADADRLRRAHDEAGLSPLGAGAMAGTPHPIRPARSAELLGLPGCYPNSMWAVADRDYVLETTFGCALVMSHLARFATEVILWTSSEFGFARLDDSVAKGSSIMPQKRNPEPAELLRGKTGRVVGDLVGLLVMLQGLPLTYNSDLQEDKEALFDALDTTGDSLEAARVILVGLAFDRQRMAEGLRGAYVTATDLADALVRAGVPFRTAHEQTGRAVVAAEARGVELWELSATELAEHCPDVDPDVLAELEPEASVRAHASPGGPAPVRVEEQIELVRERLRDLEDWLRRRPAAPIYRAHLAGGLLEASLAVEPEAGR